MIPRKSILILLILLAAAAAWVPQQQKLSQARQTLSETLEQKAEIERRMAEAKSALEISRGELSADIATRKTVFAEAARAEKELIKILPESRWANPPLQLPEWNPESPFVWLRKDLVAKLPAPVFDDKGNVRDGIASFLMLNEEQQSALKTALPRILGQYRQLEFKSAARTKEPWGDVGGGGEKWIVNIKPTAEEATVVRGQFETTLGDIMGNQRANLVLKAGSQWMDKEFNSSKEPKIISVIRDPNGKFGLSVKIGNTETSTGFPKDQVSRANDYIPPHLLPLFTEIFESTSTTASAP